MKKLVSLLLMLVFVFSLSCAMAEGKKHVENLIVGTTAANNTFNMTTQSDAFGRMNYNGLTQGNYVYRVWAIATRTAICSPIFSPATRFRKTVRCWISPGIRARSGMMVSP